MAIVNRRHEGAGAAFPRAGLRQLSALYEGSYDVLRWMYQRPRPAGRDGRGVAGVMRRQSGCGSRLRPERREGPERRSRTTNEQPRQSGAARCRLKRGSGPFSTAHDAEARKAGEHQPCGGREGDRRDGRVADIAVVDGPGQKVLSLASVTLEAIVSKLPSAVLVARREIACQGRISARCAGVENLRSTHKSVRAPSKVLGKAPDWSHGCRL